MARVQLKPVLAALLGCGALVLLALSSHRSSKVELEGYYPYSYYPYGYGGYGYDATNYPYYEASRQYYWDSMQRYNEENDALAYDDWLRQTQAYDEAYPAGFGYPYGYPNGYPTIEQNYENVGGYYPTVAEWAEKQGVMKSPLSTLRATNVGAAKPQSKSGPADHKAKIYQKAAQTFKIANPKATKKEWDATKLAWTRFFLQDKLLNSEQATLDMKKRAVLKAFLPHPAFPSLKMADKVEEDLVHVKDYVHAWDPAQACRKQAHKSALCKFVSTLKQPKSGLSFTPKGQTALHDARIPHFSFSGGNAKVMQGLKLNEEVQDLKAEDMHMQKEAKVFPELDRVLKPINAMQIDLNNKRRALYETIFGVKAIKEVEGPQKAMKHTLTKGIGAQKGLGSLSEIPNNPADGFLRWDTLPGDAWRGPTSGDYQGPDPPVRWAKPHSNGVKHPGMKANRIRRAPKGARKTSLAAANMFNGFNLHGYSKKVGEELKDQASEINHEMKEGFKEIAHIIPPKHKDKGFKKLNKLGLNLDSDPFEPTVKKTLKSALRMKVHRGHILNTAPPTPEEIHPTPHTPKDAGKGGDCGSGGSSKLCEKGVYVGDIELAKHGDVEVDAEGIEEPYRFANISPERENAANTIGGDWFGHVGDTRITKKEIQEQKARPTQLAMVPTLVPVANGQQLVEGFFHSTMVPLAGEPGGREELPTEQLPLCPCAGTGGLCLDYLRDEIFDQGPSPCRCDCP